MRHQHCTVMTLLFSGDQEKSLDDAEPIGVLHNLYLMTFNQLGREAVVRVFTMAEHLQALLPFVEFTGQSHVT